MPAATPDRRRWGWAAAVAALLAQAVFFSCYEVFVQWGPNLAPPLSDAARWQGWGAAGVALIESGPIVRLTAAPHPPALESVIQTSTGTAVWLVEVEWRHGNVRRGALNYQVARVLAAAVDAHGATRWDWTHVVDGGLGSDGWKRRTRRLVFPGRVSVLRLILQNAGSAGWMEVARVRAWPLRLNPSAGAVLAGWWLAWLAGLALAGWRLRLWSRPGGRAVTATALMATVGMVMPESWLAPIERRVHGGPFPAALVVAAQTPTSSGAARATVPSVPPATPGIGRRMTAVVRRAAAGLDLHAVAHVALFAAVAATSARSFGWRLVAARGERGALAKGVAGLVLFATGAEQSQWLTFTRIPGVEDWSLNLAGIALGLLVAEVGWGGRQSGPPSARSTSG